MANVNQDKVGIIDYSNNGTNPFPENWLLSSTKMPEFLLADLPTASAMYENVTVLILDGKRGYRTCRKITEGYYVWVEDAANINVQDFGAKCDGVTDDTIYIQAAINSLGATNTIRPARITIPNICAISDTILLERKSVILHGSGWGSLNDGGVIANSGLKWIGVAGKPMVRIHRSTGSSLRDMRLIGKSSARPTCAISMYQTALDGNPNQHNVNKNIWIGNFGGFDGDASKQFDKGIAFEGDNNNNDMNNGDNLVINQVGIGIDIPNPQNGLNKFGQISISNCDVAAVNSGTSIKVEQAFFSSNANDFRCEPTGTGANSPSFFIDFYASEGSARLLDTSNNATVNFYCRGGYYQISNGTHADGKVIKCNGNWDTTISFSNFFFDPSGYTNVTPYTLDFTHASSIKRRISFREVEGINPTVSVKLATVDASGSRGSFSWHNRQYDIEMILGEGRGSTNFSFSPDGVPSLPLDSSHSIDLISNRYHFYKGALRLVGSTSPINIFPGILLQNAPSSTTSFEFYQSGDGVYMDRVGAYNIMTLALTTKEVSFTGRISPTFLKSPTATPSGSADSQGSTRDILTDDDYIYVKTSGGWKRSALSTF